MSDYIKSFTVVLEEGIKEEGAERIGDALKMIVGVISVVPNTQTFEDLVAVERVKNELRTRLWEILK